MSTPFTLNLSLPRTVGDGSDLEVIMVPLEVRVYWHDDALHVINSRVAESVRLDNGYIVYRESEPHSARSPDDLARIKAECARLDAERAETAREDYTAMDELEPLAMPDMPELERFPANEVNQQVVA